MMNEFPIVEPKIVWVVELTECLGDPETGGVRTQEFVVDSWAAAVAEATKTWTPYRTIRIVAKSDPVVCPAQYGYAETWNCSPERAAIDARLCKAEGETLEARWEKIRDRQHAEWAQRGRSFFVVK
jgi:hypothetical protein